jgi:hypothetical protein
MRIVSFFAWAALLAAQEAQPPRIDAGSPALAPSDAVALFDGKDLSHWHSRDGKPPRWSVVAGAIQLSANHEFGGGASLVSNEVFGNAQIHVEYSVPFMPDAKGQARGNSGVYICQRYEIQVLDSWDNPTYPNGMNAALYGAFAPLVNASRRPGEWQSFDVVFHAPRCGEKGEYAAPGRMTLLHNGVLALDHVPVDKKGACVARGPVILQDHEHPDVKTTPVRFRNIWVRPLGDKAQSER